MNFLNPLFLFGLGAAAIPILIHLFTRRRPREVRFPSLEFLAEVNQSEIRRLKIKQWLLLALRTLAVAAIALAMSRPALRGASGGRGTSSVVALVDVSGSMGALGADGRPLVQTARRAIEDLLATLGPGDELWLVPYDRAVQPITEKPTTDLARLRSAAQSLTARATGTDHAAALAAATRALGEARALNRELFWISDFQSSGFPASGLVVPPGPWAQARVIAIPLAPRTRANAALTDAALAPAGDGAGAGAALTVTASAHGVSAGDFPVEVRELGAAGRDAALGRGYVSLAERGDAQALLPLARMPDVGGEAVLPGDVLPLDDRRVFAAGRAGSLRVVVREDGGPSPLALALEAGSPASGLDVRRENGATLPAAVRGADVVVIGDVERLGPAELQAVLDFWRGGGGLLLAPGERADAAFWNPSLLAELGVGELGAASDAAPGASWRMERAVAGHAVLVGFPARPGEALSSATFRRVRAMRAPTGAGTRVLLEYGRGRPALIEAPHALVLNALMGAQSSDFAVSGAFLPLLHQAAKVLGRGTAAASLAPGDRYRAPASTGDWRIEDEDGRAIASSLVSEKGAMRLVSAPLESPGLYRVFEGAQLRGSFAVNPDARESDLAATSEDAIVRSFPAGRAQVMRAGDDLARRVREARHGRELWPWFVALALALLAAESAIGRGGVRDTRKEAA